MIYIEFFLLFVCQ